MTEACCHVPNSIARAAKPKILNPCSWGCDKCQSTVEVSVCLSCGFGGCEQCSANHYTDNSNHHVVLELSEEKCYCYVCEKTFDVSCNSSLRSLCDRLRQEKLQMTPTNTRRSLKDSAIFKIPKEEFDAQDKLQTILDHWKKLRFKQAFAKWLSVGSDADNARRKLSRLTVGQLRAALKERKLSSEGIKPALIKRLTTRIFQEDSDVSMEETDADNDNVSMEDASADAESESSTAEPPVLVRKRKRQEIDEVPSESEDSDASEEIAPPAKRQKTGRAKKKVVIVRKKTKRKVTKAKKPRACKKKAATGKKRLVVSFTPGETGLRNLGNTCFMNSVIQSLSNTKCFRELILNLPEESTQTNRTFRRRATIDCFKSMTRKRKTKGKIPVSAALHDLMRIIWSGKYSVVTPYSLLQSIWCAVPKFRNHEQQDCQEFLCSLLEQLDCELRDEENSESTTSETEVLNVSPIDRLFQGAMASKIECVSCENTSTTEEPFRELVLDIPIEKRKLAAGRSRRRRKKPVEPIPTVELDRLLGDYVQSEDLESGSYKCEKCKIGTDAKKQFAIQQLPKILVIVIKRFCWTELGLRKIETNVSFPMKLDMAPYIEVEEDDDMEESEEPNSYRLKGVVVHHGNRLSSGHYTSYCANDEVDTTSDADVTEETWYHYNDSKVELVDTDEVIEASPYLLFYEFEGT